MLQNLEGKRIKANGLKSLQEVRTQFRKSGHLAVGVPTIRPDGRLAWCCECGALLLVTKKGRTFNELEAIERPEFNPNKVD